MAQVLLAEDDDGIATLATRLLSASGHSTVRCSNGLEALDCLIESGPHDLLVTDVMMPVMGGRALIRRVRALHDNKTFPILAISATECEDDLLQAGATRFLAKPFSKKEFIEVAQSLLHESSPYE